MNKSFAFVCLDSLKRKGEDNKISCLQPALHFLGNTANDETLRRGVEAASSSKGAVFTFCEYLGFYVQVKFLYYVYKFMLCVC